MSEKRLNSVKDKVVKKRRVQHIPDFDDSTHNYCTKCHNVRKMNKFKLKANGSRNKTCMSCSTLQKAVDSKRTLCHGYTPSQCPHCNPDVYCECGSIKRTCFKCSENKSSFCSCGLLFQNCSTHGACEHGPRKSRCPKCKKEAKEIEESDEEDEEEYE